MLAATLAGCAAFTPVQHPAVALPHIHPFGATRLAFSPDGTRLASGGHQGEVRLWSVPSGDAITTLRGHHAPIRGLAWLDDAALVSGALDGKLVAWDPRSGEANEVVDSGAPITALAVLDKSPPAPLLQRGETPILVTGHADGYIRVYTHVGIAADGRPYSGLEQTAQRRFGSTVLSLAARPEGTGLAASFEDGRVLLLDPSLHSLGELPQTGRRALELRFSPDGRHLVGSAWFKLMVWDLASGELEIRGTEHHGAVISVDFSPDGRHLASIGRHTDARVRLTEFATGQVERRLAPHALCGYAVRFSPNGRYLATGSEDESVRLYDLSAPYRPTITPPH